MIAKTTGFLMRRRRGLIAPSIPTTASGAVAEFVSATVQPVDVVAQIVPMQAGSGDPAPDNVRPISGWTGLTVYHGAEAIPVTWTDAGTVYGGTLDLSSGVLTVSAAMTRIEDLSLSYSPVYNRFSSASVKNTIKWPPYNDAPLDGLMCEIYQTGPASSSMAPPDSIACSAIGQILIYTTEYTSPSDFKQAYGTKKIIYPLAEPLTYQLDPVHMLTVAGENSISHDAGTITATYKRYAWQGVTT